MFKSVSIYGSFNAVTGYGIHLTNFVRELEKLIPVIRNKPGGEVSISLLDSVSVQYVKTACPFPSILYNVWESTRQPDKFMENCKKFYHQLWVPSKWQKKYSVEQGLEDSFVKVVPEGVDPEKYQPFLYDKDTSGRLPEPIFNFLIVGKWEDRKYTREMIRAWLDAFPEDKFPYLRLHVKADNPFPVDQYKTTEQRLKAYGLEDKRIIPVHFESQESHIKRLQAAEVYLSCSRAEGWNLPLIEALACGIPSIALDWSGSTEFYHFTNLLVGVEKLIKPFNVYGQPNCPGQWAEPNYQDLKDTISEVYEKYSFYKKQALAISTETREEFSWAQAAKKAYAELEELYKTIAPKKIICEISTEGVKETTDVVNNTMFSHEGKTRILPDQDIFVVGAWPSSQDRMQTLIETISQIKALGYPVMVSSHYPLPAPVTESVDYYIFDKENPLSDDWKLTYYRQNEQGEMEARKGNKPYHAVACLTAMRNAIDFCKGKFRRMYYMEFDLEVDLPAWLEKTKDADGICLIDYQGTGYRSDFFAGPIDLLDKVFPRIRNWNEYSAYSTESGFILENWIKQYWSDYYKDVPITMIEDILLGNRFDQVERDVWGDDVFLCHFVEGPYLQVNGMSNRTYQVSFTTPEDGVIYRAEAKCGTWVRPSIKFFREWQIEAKHENEVKFSHQFDAENQRVLISMGSKALGDNLAWAPYLEEFRMKHKCHLIASTFFNGMFDYPEWELAEPGDTIKNLYASFEVGCYDGQLNKNPTDWRLVTLQQIATDILGLPYVVRKPKLKIPDTPRRVEGKYICFSEFSTMQPKLWNKENAWQRTIDYLCSLGYKCVALGMESSKLQNIIKHHGQTIEESITDLLYCDFYVGLGHGPSWLAWALDKPVVMISGFSLPLAEFENPYRVIRTNVCHGCFNDPKVKFDRGWEWCERKMWQGKKVQRYECTRKITPDMVIKTIDQLRADYNLI